MAVITYSNQYRYNKRGPLDSKALVKTYAELLNQDTWMIDGTMAAYNGMVTAVWLDKDENKNLSAKNGIYFLFDPATTSAVKVPDVSNENNWHKIAELSDIADISNRLSSIDTEITELKARVSALEEDSDVITYGYRSGFPVEGEEGKLYIAVDEGKSYVWFNDGYLQVSGGSEYEEPEVIYGGSAD